MVPAPRPGATGRAPALPCSGWSACRAHWIGGAARPAQDGAPIDRSDVQVHGAVDDARRRRRRRARGRPRRRRAAGSGGPSRRPGRSRSPRRPCGRRRERSSGPAAAPVAGSSPISAVRRKLRARTRAVLGIDRDQVVDDRVVGGEQGADRARSPGAARASAAGVARPARSPAARRWRRPGRAAAGLRRRRSRPASREHLARVQLRPERRRLLQHRRAGARRPCDLHVDPLEARDCVCWTKLAAVSPRARATATAVPSDGWPANGISPLIIQMRWR